MRSVIILCDTVRRDYLSCYGNDWVQTPALDRLARDCVRFDNHYVGSLPCMPARRELFTGRQHFLHTIWGGLEPYDRTWLESLRERGTFTHLITDHYHYFHRGGENYQDGFDTWDFQRGQENDVWVSSVDQPALPAFAAPTKQNVQNWLNRQLQRREEDYSGPRCVASALDWLDRNAASDDWSLMLELFDPHEPFVVPPDYLELYDDDWQGPFFDWPAYAPCGESAELVAHVRRRYAALLTMVDRQLGRVLAALREHGIYDDTLIVFTTDHGTCLGEHDYWMKNYFPVWQELAHIPLLVHFPGGRGAGATCSALTQTHDLCRTICRHHDAAPPPMDAGIAFDESFSGERRRAAGIFGYWGMSVNCTDGQHVYMRNPVTPANDPLAMYTSLPCSRQWLDERHRWSEVTCDSRFSFSDLPLYRLAMDKAHDVGFLHDEAGGLGRHQLWDVVADQRQERALVDADIEAGMREHLIRCMQEWEAPTEQYQRLGLA